MSVISKVTNFRAVILASAIAVSGCGNTVESVPVTPPPAPPAKALLDDVANSGELGSGASSIRDALTELQKTDAAKADALLKDLDKLEGMTTPAQIKAKAKEMAGKL